MKKIDLKTFLVLVLASAALCFLTGCLKFNGRTVVNAGNLIPPKVETKQIAPGEIQDVAIVVTPPSADKRAEGFVPGITSAIEQEFTQAFLKKGYSLVSRERLQQVLREQEFQSSGRNDLSKAVKEGRLGNATHILEITIAQFRAERRRERDARGRIRIYGDLDARIDSQLINVKTGEPVAACTDSSHDPYASSLSECIPFIAALAKRIARAYPAHVRVTPVRE